jgi:hypothetical protein
MNRRLALWTVLLTTTTASPLAFAQQGQGEVTIGYQGLPYKPSGESRTGIQVSDTVLMHVGAGAEAGYDSNVFYAESNATGSAIYRANMFASMTNASRAGTAMSRVTFDGRFGLQYRRYQSADLLEEYRNAWLPTAGLSISAGGAQLGFGLADTFARIEEAPYVSGQPPIIRNNNQFSVEGRWSPGGGRLTSLARYTNMIDIFSSGGYAYADSATNYLMLDGSWKWLPKTAIFLNVTQGYVFYLNPTPKETSFPLRVTTGLRGLLTDRLSSVLALGYQNGFYSSGATTGGFFGSTFAELSFTFRPTQLSRIVAGVRNDFQNSIISAFYYAQTVYLSYVQQIAGRLALDLSGRYVHRTYEGLLPSTGASGRVDDFFQAGATLDYFVRNWMYAGVGYALLLNDATITPITDGTVVPAAPDSANYVKQQVFVRLGLTY